VEQNTGLETLQQKKPTPFTSRVDIFVHTRRKRLIDPDGLSAKAAIDGIVHRGLLADDSATHVRKVETWSQEKAGKDEEEETIITITEVIE